MSIDRAQVDAALAAVVDPNTGRPYAANKGVRNVAIDGDVVALDVVLGYPARSHRSNNDKRRMVTRRQHQPRTVNTDHGLRQKFENFFDLLPAPPKALPGGAVRAGCPHDSSRGRAY